MVKLTRAKENPILTPSDSSWENMLVFNPGAVMVEDKVYLIYRAMGKNDIKSRLGLAISSDGIHFEREKWPLYSGDGLPDESLGIEDARIVKIDDTYYITCTAVSEDTGAEVANWKGKRPQIALSTTKDFKTFVDYDVIIPHLLGKNASFFPKKMNGEYWLLYRAGLGKTYFAKSTTLVDWQNNTHSVFEQRPGMWDSAKCGVGAPPIETEKGWLLFYHGVDEKNIYRLGIMFLDRNDPTKILYRSPEPIFEPEADYERFGFVPNVVFTCGAIEKDGLYYVYYGAADHVIGVATVEKKLVLNLF
ncbi:MAG: glycosidase [Candidatus Curtissbacteria bacterium]|nr:glycosidase [Candidatus Curtissbacteria bacterium]